MTLRIGLAHAPAPGNIESGDLELVQFHEQGAIIAAIDGIGHGSMAAWAADLARQAIEGEPGLPLVARLQNCHRLLRGTRGVVVSMALLDLHSGLMHWVGVGNVRGVLLRPAGAGAPRREELLLRPGVVGADLPPLKVTTTPIGRRDVVILATDGIRGEFADHPVAFGSPHNTAREILARFRAPADDALVLVARLA
jgi:phosphoserine phosphatase RsbX